MNSDELQRLCEFIYRHTGMMFTESKSYYVERRILERMKATGAVSFDDYFARLRANMAGEIEHLINAFTVNETFFYREDHQLRCLTRDLLTDLTAGRPASSVIRIWSIPCATGEEPFSIALWLLENWPQINLFDVEIVGSDIDTRTLTEAREGIFGKRALMRLDPALIRKYFVPCGEDQWKIIDEIRESVRFSRVNLVNRQEMLAQGPFDVIFCRNVLIYFDDASRRIAAENLYDCMHDGAYVCLGHSESMSRISPLFDVSRFEDAIVYRKPLSGRRD